MASVAAKGGDTPPYHFLWHDAKGLGMLHKSGRGGKHFKLARVLSSWLCPRPEQLWFGLLYLLTSFLEPRCSSLASPRWLHRVLVLRYALNPPTASMVLLLPLLPPYSPIFCVTARTAPLNNTNEITLIGTVQQLSAALSAQAYSSLLLCHVAVWGPLPARPPTHHALSSGTVLSSASKLIPEQDFGSCFHCSGCSPPSPCRASRFFLVTQTLA